MTKNHKIGLFRFGAAYWKWYPIFPRQPFWASAIMNFVIKCYFLWTHYHIITKICWIPWRNLKGSKVSGQWHILVRRYNENVKTANNVCLLLPVVVTLVFIDSENNDAKYATRNRTCWPPFWTTLKTYFFKILLDRCFDFHQNWLRTLWGHAGKKLLNDFW